MLSVSLKTDGEHLYGVNIRKLYSNRQNFGCQLDNFHGWGYNEKTFDERNIKICFKMEEHE